MILKFKLINLSINSLVVFILFYKDNILFLFKSYLLINHQLVEVKLIIFIPYQALLSNISVHYQDLSYFNHSRNFNYQRISSFL